MVGSIISDPVFQFGIFGSVVGTIALLLALRAHMGAHPVAVARGTRIVLALAVLSVLLVSGWSGWNAWAGPKGRVSASSPASSMSPTAAPTATPTPESSPTSTPHLSRSITQVLTAFCQAMAARDYPTAWSLYATSLQSRHAYTAVVAAWSQYTACSIPGQGYDPDALEVLTLTLTPGAKDPYRMALPEIPISE